MADLRRTLRGVADGSGDVVHGSGGLLKFGGLLLGAARQIVGGGADLAGTRMGAFRAIGDSAQYGAHLRRHGVEVVDQFAVTFRQTIHTTSKITRLHTTRE